MEKLAGFLLLLATLNVARAQDKGTAKYFKDGGVLTLELSPRPTEPLTNVVWKLEGNFVAEWFKNKETGKEIVPLTFYRTFKGRATMDLTTGRLEISNMTKADAGAYSVEVNSVVQTELYNAVLIKEVPEPGVVPRPLTCSSASENCTLTCDADPAVLVDAGPLTYSWRKGDGGWTESGKDLDITKKGSAGVETFTCRIQNPVSARESKPQRNPLLGEEQGGSNAGVIAGVVIGIIVAAGIGGGIWYSKKKNQNTGGVSSPAGAGAAAAGGAGAGAAAAGGASVENGRKPEPSDKKPGAAEEELESLNGHTNQDGGEKE